MTPFMRVTCPACSARLRAPASPPRRRGKCARCGACVPLPAGEPEPRPTDQLLDMSAEVRAVCQTARAEASAAARRWLTAYYRGTREADRRRVLDATRHLRAVHVRDGRGGFDRRRARAFIGRIPADTLREMDAIVESPAGDWMPSGLATLREAFERFEDAAGLPVDAGAAGDQGAARTPLSG